MCEYIRMKKLIVAAVAALAVLLPTTADAARTLPETPASYARTRSDCPAFPTYDLPAHPDYGSGCLDPLWYQRTHGMYGTLSNADVFIVGDSITTLCKNSLVARLDDAGLTSAVNYWSSRPTKIAVDFALSMSAPPAKLVMAVGTNDIFDPDEMAAQIERLTSSPKFANTEIYWVDVQASRPSFATADQRNSEWVNRQIWAAGPNVHVVNWASLFYSSPNRIGNYLQADGVHPIASPAPGVGCEFWGADVFEWITQ